MITRIPIDRTDLKINKNYKVLEIGSGHNPTFRADTIVEKYIYNNTHRSGNIKIFPHQTLINAEGENLPFEDNAFDYVICNQVIEHSTDPAQFIKEITRVSKKGYVEVPSLIGESLFPKESHKWAILKINNQLVFYDKNKITLGKPNYGVTFLDYLPYQNFALQLFFKSVPQSNVIRFEWENDIPYVIDPLESEYTKYIDQEWTMEMTKSIFPPTTKINDIKRITKAFYFIAKGKFNKKFNKKEPLSLESYLKKTQSTQKL